MTKPAPPRRIQVRPINRASLLDRQFKRVTATLRKKIAGKVHPLIVLADLRRGSLGSLTHYLAQEGGIPDRAVAIELRKMISGSVHRSRFRLLIVEHPDRPRNSGGHPSKRKNKDTSARYSLIFASYEKALLVEGKKYAARAQVAIDFECDESTVSRAIRSVREGQKRDQERALREDLHRVEAAKIVKRRDNALAKLRKGTDATSS